jgi:enediyne biosynthesis protein E4
MDGGNQWRMIKTGSSYLSQSEMSATFGLGRASGINGVEVVWPSGRVERVGGEKAGQVVTITEGRGVTSRIPFSK